MRVISVAILGLAFLTIAIVGPTALADVPTAPTPPTDFSVSPGDSSVIVQWSPPLSDGGSPLTAYHVYAVLDGLPHMVGTTDPGQTSYSVTGTAADAGGFYATAVNVVGESPPSLIDTAYPRCEIISTNPIGYHEDCWNPPPQIPPN